jgi:hypothetical protein
MAFPGRQKPRTINAPCSRAAASAMSRCGCRIAGVYSVGILGRTQVNTRPAYDQGDDIAAAPPLRSEVKRWALAGYEYEPCIQIKRPLPTPLTVLSVAQEVITT